MHLGVLTSDPIGNKSILLKVVSCCLKNRQAISWINLDLYCRCYMMPSMHKWRESCFDQTIVFGKRFLKLETSHFSTRLHWTMIDYLRPWIRSLQPQTTAKWKARKAPGMTPSSAFMWSMGFYLSVFSLILAQNDGARTCTCVWIAT